MKTITYACRICLLLLACVPTWVSAQDIEMEERLRVLHDSSRISLRRPVYLEVSPDEAIRLFNRQPHFGLYKDNYFITGIPTNTGITRHNADAKFQVSIRHRLASKMLPYNTVLMLTYTQKSFWNIYEESAPFGDNNYNPGFSLMKAVISDNKLRGIATFSLEHESNGKDSTESRSWNYAVLSGIYFFNGNLSAQAKLWAGQLGNENKDLYRYRGYGLVALNYRTSNDVFWVSAIVNPRTKFGNFNTQLELNLKMNPVANQYLFLQWYNGYGESLLEYKRYTSMIRLGICIKPPHRNMF